MNNNNNVNQEAARNADGQHPNKRSKLEKDYRTWCDDRNGKAKSLEYLDTQLITADLHTHLLGMGDHTFWIEEIMRSYLFSATTKVGLPLLEDGQRDEKVASLEWYGPLCYRLPPSVELALKAPKGTYSVIYHGKSVPMTSRADGYYASILPASDPFTFNIEKTDGNTVTKSYTATNYALSKHFTCVWDGTSTIEVSSSAKQHWERIGLKNDAWIMYTILNWEDLKPVQMTDKLVSNILRSHRERDWLNLPLSPSLCEHLSSLKNIPDWQSDWNWQSDLKFVTDVVFDIDSFQESLNIDKKFGIDNVLHELTARLALNRHGNSDRYLKQYMFFNVKTQQFDYQWGITNTDLCFLMEASNKADIEAKATLAQIRNCFTMLNVDGTTPSNSDLIHRFRRHFTPEFYPMRFKLRDPIYAQRPKTLTLLLLHTLKNYSQSRTTYVEFSLGLKDLTTPWIYQYLVDKSIWGTIYGPEVTNGDRAKMEYRFLLGIQRHLVKLPINGELRMATSDEALDFLIKYPYLAMGHSFNPEAYTNYTGDLQQLKSILELLQNSTKKPERGLLNTLVGLDLVSEELGFPYCPFIQDSWLQLAWEFKLGIRLHCGEGVIREKKGSIEMAMYAHMYIMALAIRRIRAKGLKCRIGHGVAFQDCIINELPDDLKKLEEVQSAYDYCITDGSKILTPFLPLISDILVEVNMTSNSFLVQYADASSLLKLLDNWLLCTDDDGVWAPPPCAHQHQLQAREYCQAISLGFITKDDLMKAGDWKKFRFALEQPGQMNTLALEDTWTCRFQNPRPYAIILLALCSTPNDFPDAILPLGVTELLHSFGYYNGFVPFASTVSFLKLEQRMITPEEKHWLHEDRKIQYFLKLINPDGTYFSILRSLFLGFDECIHLIRYEKAIQTLCEAKTQFPVPPMLPRDKIKGEHDSRKQRAQVTIDAATAALRRIIAWIKNVKKAVGDLKKKNEQNWIKSRLALIAARGRSEMEYGRPYSPQGEAHGLDALLSEKWIDEIISLWGPVDIHPTNKAEQVDIHPADEAEQVRLDRLLDALSTKWIGEVSRHWGTVVEKAEQVPQLDGLIICDARFWKGHDFYQNQESFFHIIWNTQDWYIRPLPPTYFSQFVHVDSADCEKFHANFAVDDKIPLAWYNAALAIAKRLFNATNKNAQTIRIAGVGYSGSAVAVLAGLMIATELRYQEMFNGQSSSNEVVVWSYGGRQFGSKAFHRKVHNLCSYNLEVTRWLSLHDKEAGNGFDELFVQPHCSQKEIEIYPSGPPTIMAWELRPSWHYFTLMLHHLPPCMDFRDDIRKENEMSIFFADKDTDLKSLAQSLYFPQYTLVCTHNSEDEEFGPLAKKKSGVIVRPIFKKEDIRIPPYVWKWHPQQHKTWVDIFDQTPVQTTLRLLGDLLLAITKLHAGVLISLSPKHCDIFNFITMSQRDLQELDAAKAKHISASLKNFMNLTNRKDFFDEEYCLLLLDFICTPSMKLQDKMNEIKHKLDKAFSTSIPMFRQTSSFLISNMEILLTVLRMNKLYNPFLQYVLIQLTKKISDMNPAVGEKELRKSMRKEIRKLLKFGSPNQLKSWPLTTELGNSATADYCIKYKELLDETEDGSYKAFDYALSVYFLNAKEKLRVIEVSLQRVWELTDWMSRRIKQKEITGEQWHYREERTKDTLDFLTNLEDQMSPECSFIYEVEKKKFDFLTGAIKDSKDLWKEVEDKLQQWFALENRKFDVLLADAFFRYGETMHETIEDKKEFCDKCNTLIDLLSKVADKMADWIKASLFYLLGQIDETSKSFEKAVSIYSSLWELGIQPKDKCSIALNAACCYALAGGEINTPKAIYWVGNFFDVLKKADEVDRRIAFDWLQNELQHGDLREARSPNIKKLVEPWLNNQQGSQIVANNNINNNR